MEDTYNSNEYAHEYLKILVECDVDVSIEDQYFLERAINTGESKIVRVFLSSPYIEPHLEDLEEILNENGKNYKEIRKMYDIRIKFKELVNENNSLNYIEYKDIMTVKQKKYINKLVTTFLGKAKGNSSMSKVLGIKPLVKNNIMPFLFKSKSKSKTKSKKSLSRKSKTPKTKKNKF